MTKKDIRDLYKEWRKENGNKKPNRAIVKMRWDDDDNTEKGYQVDTIAIDPRYKWDENVPSDDCWILFYVSSLDGLLSLMTPNNGSDFTLLEVLEFYKK